MGTKKKTKGRTRPPPDDIAIITEIAKRVFRTNGGLREVAKLAGVSHETIRKWMRIGKPGEPDHDPRYLEFARACETERAEAKLKLLGDMRKRDPKWLLQAVHGMGGDKHEVNTKGKLAIDLLQQAITSVPDDEDKA